MSTDSSRRHFKFSRSPRIELFYRLRELSIIQRLGGTGESTKYWPRLLDR